MVLNNPELAQRVGRLPEKFYNKMGQLIYSARYHELTPFEDRTNKDVFNHLQPPSLDFFNEDR